MCFDIYICWNQPSSWLISEKRNAEKVPEGAVWNSNGLGRVFVFITILKLKLIKV